jgi:hypothetical protein
MLIVPWSRPPRGVFPEDTPKMGRDAAPAGGACHPALGRPRVPVRPPLRGAAFNGWTRLGRRRAKACRIGEPAGLSSQPGSHGPEDRNRRHRSAGRRPSLIARGRETPRKRLGRSRRSLRGPIARVSRFPALRSPHLLREREFQFTAYPAPDKQYGRFRTPGASPRSLQFMTRRRRHNSPDLQMQFIMDARVIGVLEERRSSNGYARA